MPVAYLVDEAQFIDIGCWFLSVLVSFLIFLVTNAHIVTFLGIAFMVRFPGNIVKKRQ